MCAFQWNNHIHLAQYTSQNKASAVRFLRTNSKSCLSENAAVRTAALCGTVCLCAMSNYGQRGFGCSAARSCLTEPTPFRIHLIARKVSSLQMTKVGLCGVSDSSRTCTCLCVCWYLCWGLRISLKTLSNYTTINPEGWWWTWSSPVTDQVFAKASGGTDIGPSRIWQGTSTTQNKFV